MAVNRIICTVCNVKGGVGKTTLAASLAAMFALAGREVLLVDTDVQQSATAWSLARSIYRSESQAEQDIVCVSKTGKIGYDIARLSEKYDVTIIDAGGRDSVEMRQAMVISDIIVVPVQPGQFDNWAMSEMVNMLQSVRKQTGEDKVALAVINRAPTNASLRVETEQARELLQEYADHLTIAGFEIHDRVAFRKGVPNGQVAVELTGKNYDPIAVAEISRLYQEIAHEQFNNRTATAQVNGAAAGPSAATGRVGRAAAGKVSR